jgi:starch synthase
MNDGHERSLRCLFAASEVAGFAKTGGLADVAGSLPNALAERGVDMAVILPLYRCVRTDAAALEPTDFSFTVSFGAQQFSSRLWRSKLPGSTVPVYLVEQADFFERDDPALGRGIYQFTGADGVRADYADNSLRYAFFSRAVLEAIRLLNFWPDVLHINDWQTGLVPVYLREIYRQSTRHELRQRYDKVRTLCTIHNLAYQGVFAQQELPILDMPWRLFNYEALEFYGRINFLKAGIVFADLLNTVSPMYAREIQTPYFGCGLHGVLLQRTRDLCGIVNGVDYKEWNPAGDRFLTAHYDPGSVTRGKAACKAALQKALGLEVHPAAPLLGMVSRLVAQKGVDLLMEAAPALLSQGVQLAILGQGDSAYQRALSALQIKHRGQVAVEVRQNEALAHQIEAGADIFLMPSQFEPCGLNQLYSLKYGTIPVIRATGGLANTVVDANDRTLADGSATGFVFIPPAAAEFIEAVHRALDTYRNRPQTWLALQQTGMRQDWSWNRSAGEYEKLYRRLRDE